MFDGCYIKQTRNGYEMVICLIWVSQCDFKFSMYRRPLRFYNVCIFLVKFNFKCIPSFAWQFSFGLSLCVTSQTFRGTFKLLFILCLVICQMSDEAMQSVTTFMLITWTSSCRDVIRKIHKWRKENICWFSSEGVLA